MEDKELSEEFRASKYYVTEERVQVLVDFLSFLRSKGMVFMDEIELDFHEIYKIKARIVKDRLKYFCNVKYRAECDKRVEEDICSAKDKILVRKKK